MPDAPALSDTPSGLLRISRAYTIQQELLRESVENLATLIRGLAINDPASGTENFIAVAQSLKESIDTLNISIKGLREDVEEKYLSYATVLQHIDSSVRMLKDESAQSYKAVEGLNTSVEVLLELLTNAGTLHVSAQVSGTL